MAGRDLKLQVVFAALDKITGPLKKIMGGSSDTAKALKATSDRLRELNIQQRNLGKFRELHSGINATRAKLKEAQDKLNDLAAKMKQTEAPTRAMTRELKAATKVTQDLTLKGREQSQQFRALRASLKEAGIDTRQLGKAQEWLKNSIQLTNVELASQQKRLAASAAKQQRVANATQHADKLRSKAGSIAMAGAGATAAGAVAAAPVVKGLHEAKHYEIETARIRALGTRTAKEKEHAIAFAKELKTYGVSQLEKTEMIRDSISIFADGHHAEMALPSLAKMKFINDTLYPDSAGERNAQLFAMQKVIELRGNAGSVEAFKKDADRIQKIIAATGGRVSGEEWRQFTIRSGVAGKGLTDNAFFNQMEPMLQELGGSTAGVGFRSLYNNIVQGRTTQRSAREMQALGLLNGTHIKYDKVGQIKYIQAGALLEGELFQKSPLDWVEKVFLPKLAAKGITDEDAINSKIGTLISNSNGAAFLMRVVGQRLQMRKSERLNQNTEGMDKLHDRARAVGAGAEHEAHAKLSDLKLVMGEKILPMYTQALEMAIAAFARLNGFMERNPTVAKVMITAFAVLAGLLLVLGPLMLGIAAMIGPYAMLHVMFAKMGVTGGVLTPILRGLGGAFMWTGRAVLWLGRAFMLNPIGLAVTAIAGAAYLIYKYWEPIKAFFSGIWSHVKTAFAGGIGGVSTLIANWSPLGLFYRAFAGVLGWFGIALPAKFSEFGAGILQRITASWEPIAAFFADIWSRLRTVCAGGMGNITALIINWSPVGVFYQAFAGVMSWFGIKLPAQFTEFGANILRGLVNGITGSMGAVKDAISNAGSSTIAWFKEKLGIHSPSRVFAELGDYTMQGLAVGLDRSEGAPIAKVSGLAQRLTQLGAGIAIGTATALPASAFDTRAPLSQGGFGAGMTIQGDKIEITIQAQAGSDPQAIARAVYAAMEQRDREKAARIRSSLRDHD
ncbi:phage tail protein [Janthinobacterium sp. GW460P]|uniref:hypothetical protein n=1 Tax=unclassified Janthinobacterium TaxID=2610881 RepID=UPI000A321E6D|nr:MULTISPECIES: hypothetical protein [unclassified Janthinobacterium]MCC7701437.1 phage tail protein [Janthinobacterium sp. GW460P]MCC7706944.1 phage tail protein [Janthinobacterium sp. GW460W]